MFTAVTFRIVLFIAMRNFTLTHRKEDNRKIMENQDKVSPILTKKQVINMLKRIKSIERELQASIKPERLKM